MCGEKFLEVVQPIAEWGSPPRVRGKGLYSLSLVLRAGITPACAGKSSPHLRYSTSRWDHPRVCGEKENELREFAAQIGSPPRVRGKGPTMKMGSLFPRITPACAGKRSFFSRSSVSERDHPRVCGEKHHPTPSSADSRGSPPRVRGKGRVADYRQGPCGITPACAGKSLPRSQTTATCRDHPRVCGEKAAAAAPAHNQSGSPPRVRGKGLCFPALCKLLGITPACAGKSKDKRPHS